MGSCSCPCNAVPPQRLKESAAANALQLAPTLPRSSYSYEGFKVSARPTPDMVPLLLDMSFTPRPHCPLLVNLQSFPLYTRFSSYCIAPPSLVSQRPSNLPSHLQFVPAPRHPRLHSPAPPHGARLRPLTAPRERTARIMNRAEALAMRPMHSVTAAHATRPASPATARTARPDTRPRRRRARTSPNTAEATPSTPR